VSKLKSCLSVGRIEAGCDEAGRGCLAGPVVASAVIIPEGWHHPDLDDSKKLSPRRRERIAEFIKKEIDHWAIGSCSPEEVDRYNILNASFIAMHRALDQLKLVPDCILVDGNRFKPYREIIHECVIKGDGIFSSIAAASVLAKTHRDEWMKSLHDEYPDYGWDSNMGYPTKQHREAIAEIGPSPYHRKSFTLLREQPSLF